ncbi:LacI family DNA-binding transcriptional regulator [Catellatospora sp. TT07R-123]|uniref:LacI family DNA-binding transcriptional regulator n=1 Tax=Catellatospora sp. TT07R-123 TaxID=2733863 RepID=UPI001BB33A35|nr:LacI family DNA-binding transcriptional regulator [Catellatospora sp. TT07R-123]
MTSRLAAVAKFTGVSEATVSRVLHNKPGIAPATRDAVLTALDVFGFPRPERIRAERGRLVGLVLPDLQNPIFPAFAEVIAQALIKRGLVPALCTRTADGVSESHYIEMLLSHQVGGIVFVGGSYADAGPEQCRRLEERRLPIVLLNAADENLGVPRVCVDDELAVDQALTHLTALGHERIGLVLGPPGHIPSARKLAAYVRFFEQRGQARQWRRWVEHTIFSTEGGRGAATRLLAEGVTGIVCASDALALGAVRAVRKQGLSVPQDVSVIGFDDSVFMGVTDPPLTTIRQPIEPMAAAAVAALMAQIEGGVVDRGEILFDPELIVRSSTGPCPS